MVPTCAQSFSSDRFIRICLCLTWLSSKQDYYSAFESNVDLSDVCDDMSGMLLIILAFRNPVTEFSSVSTICV